MGKHVATTERVIRKRLHNSLNWQYKRRGSYLPPSEQSRNSGILCFDGLSRALVRRLPESEP